MAGHRDHVPPTSPIEHRPHGADDPVREAIDALTRALASGALSPAARAALERLERAWLLAQHGAETDPLTQLPNRAHFERALSAAIRGTERVVLMFLDLDGFKGVNDRFGHRAGDLLLKAVARRVASSVREGDLVARYGGDEFVVLLKGPAASELAPILAQRIVENVSTAYSLEGITFQLSISVGLAMWPEHARDLDTLVERADRAMYRAKRRGGGRYTIYEDALDNQQESGLVALDRERDEPSSGS